MHCELHSLNGKYVEALFQIETLDFIEGGLKRDIFHRSAVLLSTVVQTTGKLEC